MTKKQYKAEPNPSSLPAASALQSFLSNWNGEIFAIAAIDEFGALGLNGQLLVKDKADMQHFRLSTIGCTLLAGRKTADTLGFWRTAQVLSQRKLYVATAGCVVEDGNKDFRATLATTKLAVIGGSEIYSQALDYCSRVVLTRHKGNYEADTWFPMNKLSENFVLYSTSYSTLATGGELIVQTWLPISKTINLSNKVDQS